MIVTVAEVMDVLAVVGPVLGVGSLVVLVLIGLSGGDR